VSCAPDPRSALHAQVTGRAPVTGRVVFARGWFEGSRRLLHTRRARSPPSEARAPWRRARCRTIAPAPTSSASGPPTSSVRGPNVERDLAAATQALRRPRRTGRTWPWENNRPGGEAVAVGEQRPGRPSRGHAHRCNDDPISDTSDHHSRPLHSCNWLVRRLPDKSRRNQLTEGASVAIQVT